MVINIDAIIGNGPGEISAKSIKSQLPTNGEPITARVHCEGGSVFEAFAIFDALAAYPGRKKAVVSSMAFSAGSLLLCAFDEVEITQNGYVMIHSPHMDGDNESSPSERKLIQDLRTRMVNIYSAKTGQPVATISRLIDQETFFDAEASISIGIVDKIADRVSMVTARLPRHVLAKLNADKGKPASVRWRDAVASAKASGMTYTKAVASVECSHPGLREAYVREANRR